MGMYTMSMIRTGINERMKHESSRIYKYHKEKMSTKNPKAAQRTQRHDFDKAICLDFSYFGCKALSTSNFVSFVLPLSSLC